MSDPSDTVLKLLRTLSKEADQRLKTLTVSTTGVTMEFYPEGLHTLPGGKLVAVSDNPVVNEALGEEPDDEDEAFDLTGSTLDGAITATSYVDLLTLVAIAQDTGTRWGVGRAALWLQVDPHALADYLDNDCYDVGLELWRKVLTPDEQRLLKVALQNIVLANPFGPLEETIENLSKSDEVSEATRKYLVDRYTLNEQVIHALNAPDDALSEN